jgi:hypothetical protein
MGDHGQKVAERDRISLALRRIAGLRNEDPGVICAAFPNSQQIRSWSDNPLAGGAAMSCR